MTLYQIEYTDLARVEEAEAYHWYDQAHINKGMDFVEDIDRTFLFSPKPRTHVIHERRS